MPTIPSPFHAILERPFLVPLLALLCFLTLNFPHRADAETDIKFKDNQGNEIVFPGNMPRHSQKKPGRWKGLEAVHDPHIKLSRRKEGLELVRVVFIEIPHPAEEADMGKIQAVYLFDKDGLVIGYQAFPSTAQEYKAEIRINGVINYFQIMIQCSKHEMWEKEIKYDL